MAPEAEAAPPCGYVGCTSAGTFRCPYCRTRFCPEHAAAEAHSCSERERHGRRERQSARTRPQGPVLSEDRAAPADAALPAAVEPSGAIVERCEYCGRRKDEQRNLWPCSRCGRKFCVRHIDLKEHHCESLQRIETPEPEVIGKETPTGGSIRFPRLRVRWHYVFLIIWIAAFGLGLYLVPSTNVLQLMLESFLNASVFYLFFWGIAGIARRGAGRKVFAMLLLMFLAGMAYENQQAGLSDLSLTSVHGVYSSENAFLANYSAPQFQSTTTPTSSQTTVTVGQPVPSSTISSRSATGARSSVFRGGWLTDDPSFVAGASKIDYPPDYAALVNYTLALINADRAAAGLAPVTPSAVPSGQQHADSMAYFGYFSHWDTQGYKPYMRYSLLGGTGAVAENAGLDSCTTSAPNSNLVTVSSCSLQNIENGLANSEWGMMNNDAVCCNNGHRDNILNPLHSRVSLGIAYNSTSGAVYLVEDFEDDYISSGSLHLSGGVVTLSGSTQQDLTGWTGTSSGAEIQVYYDPMPSTIPVSELSVNPSCQQYSELNEPLSCQYQGGYNQGTAVTTILAPCPPGYTCGSGGFTYAQTWGQNGGNFDITFSLASSQSTYGPGVYTLYLWPNGDKSQPITSLSIFVAGAG